MSSPSSSRLGKVEERSSILKTESDFIVYKRRTYPVLILRGCLHCMLYIMVTKDSKCCPQCKVAELMDIEAAMRDWKWN